eukprot:TRINITY_DN7978_c0_g1_i1.p1 TRINITY_DN7978_c0_g1~~TRINITY_DN7978_c0_g1_i1.p1  ORF type:complete len:314 (+),score=41.78 TRINITY_DN7978_c0_g1_i1:59-1000(+)
MFKNARSSLSLYFIFAVLLLGIVGLTTNWVRLREGKRPLWGHIKSRSDERDKLRTNIDTDVRVLEKIVKETRAKKRTEPVKSQPEKKPKQRKPPKEKTKITVGTSLKECTVGDSLCDKQLLSLLSYAGFSNSIHIFGSPTGSEATDDTYLSQIRDIITVHKDCRKSDSGIPLLSDVVQTLYETADEDSIDTVLFTNGDIILPSHQVVQSYKMLHKTFKQFFAVGHRTTVDSAPLRKSGIPTSLSDDFWSEISDIISQQKEDRTDAEDYFMWSIDFFKKEPFPDFRIGRPAFDNWLVNKAIHSRQPVVISRIAF